MTKTVDNKKDSSIDTPEFNEMGTARPFENIDSTADVKDKLAQKIGYKKGGSAMAPFMTRAFAEFQALKKKQQEAHKNKEKA